MSLERRAEVPLFGVSGAPSVPRPNCTAQQTPPVSPRRNSPTMKPRSQLNCRVLANCLALWLFWGLFAGAGHCYAAPSLAQNDPVKGVAQLSEASDPSNSTIHSNILRKRGATCRSNLVVNAPRCFGANRPSSNPQIGSLNGVWAFILDNGGFNVFFCLGKFC